ncbi:uncharacterized protein BYT42DRAFT_613499 [Radiomyces spectabilis]|uniref:uncharacterized protein n=1 Tax=Radiomyces spectabilis TaxID=64574 RepID=UPI00221FFA0F|nr:uncharacterized protein BYT42DRAFT_613499 [Radiomyces spectabilis]KAI8379173.1 hypothetical protein BYT42DRAFT_613499 [Radiomyces spectabilis]
MTSFFPCTSPCSPKDNHDREEPNAFDLTWRNYLPSIHQVCPCLPSRCFTRQQQPIRLEEEDPSVLLFDPNYYNDHIVHRRSDYGYFINDRELGSEFGDYMPNFVTRNPFGKLKRKNKRKNKQKYTVMEPEEDQEGPMVYEIFDEDEDQLDAEFLGDEQIASIIDDRKKAMNMYDEALYENDTVRMGPVVQEMHPTSRQQYYAARTMPSTMMDTTVDQHHDDSFRVSEHYVESSEQPEPAFAAQVLLNEHLEDLNEKLTLIRNNIMNIGKLDNSSAKKTVDEENTHTTALRDIGQPSSSDRAAFDIDSITSEALSEYEATSKTIYSHEETESSSRRYSKLSELQIPLSDASHSTAPFGSDHHPFSYYSSNNNHADSYTENSDNDRPSSLNLNLRTILDLSKKWFS